MNTKRNGLINKDVPNSRQQRLYKMPAEGATQALRIAANVTGKHREQRKLEMTV